MGSVFPTSTTRPRGRAYRPPALQSGVRHVKKHEESLQLRVCRYIKSEYPFVIFCSDSAAGMELTDNQRMKMMAMRSDDGQPDISIDYASRGYHGLRLELKKEGTVIYKMDGLTLRKQPYTRRYKRNGKLFIKRGDHLAEQAAMLQKYRDNGYCAVFAVGYASAVRIIDKYMDIKQELGLEF